MSLSPVQDEIVQLKAPGALNEDDWERLSVHFGFKNSGNVIRFLERNLFLVDVLIEAREKIDHYFGSDTPTSLEVFTDPEDLNDPMLFVLILTPVHSDDASGGLERLDQEWWLNQPYEVKRAMNIDLEYADGGV